MKNKTILLSFPPLMSFPSTIRTTEARGLFLVDDLTHLKGEMLRRQRQEHTLALPFLYEEKILRNCPKPILMDASLSCALPAPYRNKGCNKRDDHSWVRMEPVSLFHTQRK
jgi:hypothetical protein